MEKKEIIIKGKKIKKEKEKKKKIKQLEIRVHGITFETSVKQKHV